MPDRRPAARRWLALAVSLSLLPRPAAAANPEPPAGGPGPEPAAIDVRALGARGDGRADDTAAIQAAIEAARRGGLQVRRTGDPYTDADRRGGTVLLPAGRYLLSRPLLLPRSGNYAANAVVLQGASAVTTTLVAAPGFPKGRALIEWEPVKGRRVQHQGVVGLGLDIQAIPDGMAIHFAPTAKAAYAEVHAEGLYFMEFRDLVIHADNSANPAAIRLEGRVDNSRFEGLILDAGLGKAPRHSTALLAFDDDLLGAAEHARLFDYPGLNMSRVSGLSMSLRGGRGTLLRGRLAFTRVADLTQGNGALGREPAVLLRNCGEVTLENLVFEGRGEDGQLTIDHCSGVRITGLALGRTEEAPGVGIKVVASRWVHLDGRIIGAGSAPFSLNGSRLLSVDEASRDCRFERLTGSAPFEREIDWRAAPGSGNAIDYVDLRTGRRTVRDEVAPGAAVAPCPAGYAPRPLAGSEAVACARGEDELLAAGDAWVDRWPASLGVGRECAAPAGGPGRAEVACSREGAAPALLGWEEAARACAAAGKHLLTVQERLAAGPPAGGGAEWVFTGAAAEVRGPAAAPGGPVAFRCARGR